MGVSPFIANLKKVNLLWSILLKFQALKVHTEGAKMVNIDLLARKFRFLIQIIYNFVKCGQNIVTFDENDQYIISVNFENQSDGEYRFFTKTKITVFVTVFAHTLCLYTIIQ